MAYETYDDLVAYVTAHLELDSDSEAQVPNFIRSGEYRLNRLVTVPERETSVELTTAAAVQYVGLPADFRALRNARLVDDYGYTLEQVTLDALHNGWTAQSGKPVVYAISNDALQFGPVPDGEYTVEITYQAGLTPITSTNQTNWLIEANADAYLYATLWQAAAWQEDMQAALAFRSELMEIIGEMNLAGNRFRRSAPMRMRSPVVV